MRLKEEAAHPQPCLKEVRRAAALGRSGYRATAYEAPSAVGSQVERARCPGPLPQQQREHAEVPGVPRRTCRPGGGVGGCREVNRVPGLERSRRHARRRPSASRRPLRLGRAAVGSALGQRRGPVSIQHASQSRGERKLDPSKGALESRGRGMSRIRASSDSNFLHARSRRGSLDQPARRSRAADFPRYGCSTSGSPE
jgi:hypothetical protein